MDDDDDNVVAYIYPAVGTQGYTSAARTIELNATSPGYVPPSQLRPQVLAPLRASQALLHSGPPDIFSRHNREPTVDEEEHDPLDYEPSIKVTFDHIPKTRIGLRAGRSDDSELRLESLPAVGFFHFALTFDDNYCLVVRDLGSTYGTTVIYGRSERGRWSSFDWIVGGSDFLKEVDPIIVKVSQFLQFRLVIPRHNVQSKAYRDKVDRFRAGTADPEHLLDLGHVGLLSRVRTEAPSGVQTPSSRPAKDVTVRKKVGEGSFAVVYRVWNVSTGEQYALKKPSKAAFATDSWEREALIMDRIDHKHIVSLLNSRPGPAPWLHLEYIPQGSIDEHLKAGRHFSDHERRQIFAQTSDGLAYLHTLNPQIVHRDVKPGNILVKYRRPDEICIKFADFGLSREGDTLKSICGTYLYLAPEVYEASAIPRKEMTPYTALVDIWSLGVVLAELVCGLPKYKAEQSMGVEWCRSVRQRVERLPGHEHDDLLSFVLESMLCLWPGARKSATDCHKEALLLLDRSRESTSGGCGDHCSNTSDNGAPTIRVAEGRKLYREITETGNSEPSLGSSSLSRYIISDPRRRRVRSCNAPSPESAAGQAGQLFSQSHRSEEDGLVHEFNLGEDSEGERSDDEESSFASTIVIARDIEPQTEQVEESLRSRADLEDSPSEKVLRTMLEIANKAMAQGPGMCTANRADVALSVKRSRVARAPRANTSVDGVETRATKRKKTLQ